MLTLLVYGPCVDSDDEYYVFEALAEKQVGGFRRVVVYTSDSESDGHGFNSHRLHSPNTGESQHDYKRHKSYMTDFQIRM